MRYRRSRGKRDSLRRLVTWTRPRCWRILLIGNLWSWGHHRLLCWHVRVWWWWLWYCGYIGGRLRGGWSRKRPCSRHWHCSGWHTLLALRFRLLSGSNHSACSIVIQSMLLYFAVLLHVHHLHINRHPNISTLAYTIWETTHYSLPRYNTACNMFLQNSSRTLFSCPMKFFVFSYIKICSSSWTTLRGGGKDPPKCWYLLTKLYGTIPYKTDIYMKMLYTFLLS